MEECDLLIDIIQQRREIIGNKIKEGKVRQGCFFLVDLVLLFSACFSNEWTFPSYFSSFLKVVVTLVGIMSQY